MKCLLIDVGSTSLKSAVYDARLGEKGDVRRCPFPDPLRSEPPFFEVEPEEILAAVHTLIDEAMPLDAICFSVQMHGYLLGDATGRAVTPYISWQDERSMRLPEDRRYAFALPASRGVAKKPNLPLAGLHMMRLKQPRLFRLASRVYSLGSFIAHDLTGRNAAHITDLAPMGAYDARSGVMEETGLPSLEFPQALTSFAPVGTHRGAQVYAPVGDQQASTMGSGLSPSEYLLNLGTATQVCAVSEQPVYGEFESRPYFDGQTLCTVTRLTGGRTIAERIDETGLDKALAAEYAAALAKLPTRDKLLAVGGVSTHFPELIQAVLDRIGIEYAVRPEADALDGLIELIQKEWPQDAPIQRDHAQRGAFFKHRGAVSKGGVGISDH